MKDVEGSIQEVGSLKKYKDSFMKLKEEVGILMSKVGVMKREITTLKVNKLKTKKRTQERSKVQEPGRYQDHHSPLGRTPSVALLHPRLRQGCTRSGPIEPPPPPFPLQGTWRMAF